MVGSDHDSDQSSNNLSRRRFLTSVAAVGAASAGLGVLSDVEAATRAATRKAAVTPAASTTTLTVATTTTPPTLDSDYISQFIEHESVENLYDRLFELRTHKAHGITVADTTGIAPVVGQLVESWHASHDNRTYTLNLRKGVRSPVGNEFTAHDVKWTIDRALALKANGPFYLGEINLLDPGQVRVLGKYTVQMHLSAPSVMFFKIFTLPHLAIKDSKEAKKHATGSDPWATNWLKTHSAGFGPYSVSSFTPGSQLVLAANPHYHGGRVALRQVTMEVVPSSGNRLALLESGDVDIAESLAPRELVSLAHVAGAKHVNVSPANLYSCLAMEVHTHPFTDRRVRQAVAYAIPYKKVLSDVYLHTARQQRSPVPTIYEFSTPQYWHYSTNVAKAKHLLKAAGHPHGFSSSISFSDADPRDEATAIILKAGLAAAGINVVLNKLPLAAYVTQWLGGKLPMTTASVGPAVADPLYAMALWWYSKGNILDFTGYHSHTFDTLLTSARSQFNSNKRKTEVDRLQKLLVDDAPMAFIADQGAHFGVRTSVKGFNWYPDQGVRYWRLRK
jgi:peptide/nickel transport system substrate-binding protein